MLSVMSRSLLLWSIINIAACAIEIDFRITPSVVKPMETTNVTLQCVVSEKIEAYHQNLNSNNILGRPLPQQAGSEKSKTAIIRILKNHLSNWQVLIQISNVAPSLVHKLDTTVNNTCGLISDEITQNSFLKANWDVANSDVFGTYRCDVISFDNNNNAILTKSTELAVGSSLNALDFLRLLKHDVGEIRQTIDQQKQSQASDHNLIETLKTSLQKQDEQTKGKMKDLESQTLEQGKTLREEIDKLDKRVSIIEKGVASKIDELGSKINMGLESGLLMLWPRGSYGLLQPEGGCSNGGMTKWETGWVKHHTESTDRNKDEVSSIIHVKQPVLQRSSGNNFIIQSFCIKANSNSIGPDWSRGSYCINKKLNCPDLFTEGFISWDEESSAKLQMQGGTVPDISVSMEHITRINYCCRNDGPADVPIYLPHSHPFYLYRYGGKCQQVHNMNVTEEYIVFDTENDNNRDKLGAVHPDGTIANVRLELCYYSRI